MKKFFLSLLNARDPTSSKRFAGLCVLFTTISLAVVATIKNKGVCPDSMFNGLLLFASGAFTINGLETIFRKDAGNPVIDNNTIVNTKVETKIDTPDE